MKHPYFADENQLENWVSATGYRFFKISYVLKFTF